MTPEAAKDIVLGRWWEVRQREGQAFFLRMLGVQFYRGPFNAQLLRRLRHPLRPHGDRAFKRALRIIEQHGSDIVRQQHNGVDLAAIREARS